MSESIFEPVSAAPPPLSFIYLPFFALFFSLMFSSIPHHSALPAAPHAVSLTRRHILLIV